MRSRGFYAIGVWHPKTEVNIGTLWRSANIFGAAFVFTIGRRYRRQCSDTLKTPNHVPLFNFASMEDLIVHLPDGAPLVGVELCARARSLASFGHPLAAVYLLGAEDHGLPEPMLTKCHSVVQIESDPSSATGSLNVAVAGSIIMHDRLVKGVCNSIRRAA